MRSHAVSRAQLSEMGPGCCCKTTSAILTTPAIKSGHLHLIVQNNSTSVASGQCKPCRWRIPVSVKIYSNGFDHYAVLQKDSKKYGNGSVYVNLRNCRVFRADTDKHTFYVSSTISEGNSLIFQTDSLEELKDWLKAFQSQNSLRKSSCQIAPNLSPSIPRTSLLPTLAEAEEE